ncbi:hypothetical protein ABPG74_005681 [Tetrahymena malaccensis]
MGRKKRDLSHLLPFCYYCDKTFENEIILHQHQKARHFTCEKCQKKFSTADLIKSHLHQSHNENLQKVPNSLSDRSSIELKIFGMQGVPRPFIEERQKSKAKEYWDKIISEKNQKLKKEQKLKEKEQKKKQKAQKQTVEVEEKVQEQEKKAEENFDMTGFSFGFGLDLNAGQESKKDSFKPSNVFGFE